MNGGAAAAVAADVIPLGQFRSPDTRVEGEELHCYWLQNGVRRSELDDRFAFETADFRGQWELHVDFVSSSIRSDPTGLTHFIQAFQM